MKKIVLSITFFLTINICGERQDFDSDLREDYDSDLKESPRQRINLINKLPPDIDLQINFNGRFGGDKEKNELIYYIVKIDGKIKLLTPSEYLEAIS